MKKSEPKMILNVAIENSEVEEKVKIAMDAYAEKVILKNLDDMIQKVVEARIDALIKSPSWSSANKINGLSLEDFVASKTERVLTEFIDRNAKQILANKIANMI